MSDIPPSQYQISSSKVTLTRTIPLPRITISTSVHHHRIGTISHCHLQHDLCSVAQGIYYTIPPSRFNNFDLRSSPCSRYRSPPIIYDFEVLKVPSPPPIIYDFDLNSSPYSRYDFPLLLTISTSAHAGKSSSPFLQLKRLLTPHKRQGTNVAEMTPNMTL